MKKRQHTSELSNQAIVFEAQALIRTMRSFNGSWVLRSRNGTPPWHAHFTTARETTHDPIQTVDHIHWMWKNHNLRKSTILFRNKRISDTNTPSMFNSLSLRFIVDWLTLTCLGLFYTEKLGNCVHCIFIFTFFVLFQVRYFTHRYTIPS